MRLDYKQAHRPRRLKGNLLGRIIIVIGPATMLLADGPFAEHKRHTYMHTSTHTEYGSDDTRVYGVRARRAAAVLMMMTATARLNGNNDLETQNRFKTRSRASDVRSRARVRYTRHAPRTSRSAVR